MSLAHTVIRVVLPVALASATVGFLAVSVDASSRDGDTSQIDTATPAQVQQACFALGLTPPAMAVIALTPTSAALVLDALADQPESIGELFAREIGVASLTKSLSRSAAEIRSAETDLERSTAQSEYDQFAATLATERSQLGQIRDTLITNSIPGTLDSTRVHLVLNATGSNAALPPAYRILAWPEAQAKQLNAALAAEQRATQSGTTLDAQSSNLINQARANSQVRDALQAQDQHEAQLWSLLLGS